MGETLIASLIGLAVFLAIGVVALFKTLKPSQKASSLPAPAKAKRDVPKLELSGPVRDGPRKAVAGFVDEHPNEAMRVVRRWLHPDGD